jgi:hypothetical protein
VIRSADHQWLSLALRFPDREEIIGVRPVCPQVFQAVGSYEFNKNESKTGLHSDPISGVQITDVDKAGKTLAPGTVGSFEGQLFVLGKDGRWTNSRKESLYHDERGNHIGEPSI